MSLFVNKTITGLQAKKTSTGCILLTGRMCHMPVMWHCLLIFNFTSHPFFIDFYPIS